MLYRRNWLVSTISFILAPLPAPLPCSVPVAIIHKMFLQTRKSSLSPYISFNYSCQSFNFSAPTTLGISAHTLSILYCFQIKVTITSCLLANKMNLTTGCIPSVPSRNRLVSFSAKLVIFCIVRLWGPCPYYPAYIMTNKRLTNRFPWRATGTNGKVQEKWKQKRHGWVSPFPTALECHPPQSNDFHRNNWNYWLFPETWQEPRSKWRH